MRSRRTAAYSYSIIRAAAFISFSRRAISRSRSTLVIFTPSARADSPSLRVISMSSRTSLMMVLGTMPWASL